MSITTQVAWGYLVNASSGTGSVTVYTGPNAGSNRNFMPSIVAVAMAGSATTDYAVLTDGAGNVVLQVIAQTGQFSFQLGGVRVPGLTCQVFGGTNGTVSIFTE